MMIKYSKREESVRAHKLLAVFARLAFTSPCKNCDKFITPTVRVSCWAILKLSRLQRLSR